MKRIIKYLNILLLCVVTLSWILFVIPFSVFLCAQLGENLYHFIHEADQQKNMERIAKTRDFDSFENDESVSIIRCAGKAKMAVLAYERNFSDYKDVTFVFDDGTLKRFIRDEHVYVPREENYIHRILVFSDDDSGIKRNSDKPLKYINNVDSPEYRNWQEEAYTTFRNTVNNIMKINGFKEVIK